MTEKIIERRHKVNGSINELYMDESITPKKRIIELREIARYVLHLQICLEQRGSAYSTSAPNKSLERKPTTQKAPCDNRYHMLRPEAKKHCFCPMCHEGLSS